MGLNGTFKDTSFADLLQLYSLSKQTAVVRVRLGAGEKLDGVFWFADGDLVGASLGGASGREAVRQALRLDDGAFAVEVGGGAPPADGPRERLREVVMEEIVRLDEENRRVPTKTPAPTPAPGARHTGATAATGAWFVPPEALAAGTAVPLPGPATNGTAKPGKVEAASPPPGDAARRGAPPPPRQPAPPPAPPPRTGGKGLLVAAGVGMLLLAAGAAWYLVGRPAVPPPPPAAAVAPAAPKPAVRGVTDDAVLLGMVGSFTGSNKERGRAMRVGWEVAIAEVNAAGGLHGRKARLVTADDAYDPTRTLAGMKDVLEAQGAFAVVGNVGTSTSAVAIPYALEQNALFFGALSGADALRKAPPDKLVFNFRASLSREAEAAVRYLVEVRRLDPKRIAVLSQDDEFGASGRRGALKQLAAGGATEADVLLLSYPRNTADVRDALAKLREKARDVDAVVMVATYKPAATFIRKARDIGLSPFFTTVSADSTGLAEELAQSGKRYTDNVLLTQVVPVPTGGASALLRYRKSLEAWAPGEKPGSTSLEAWIGAQIFFEGLRRAGKDLDTQKLAAALEEIRDWDIGIGGPITFGAGDHQGSDLVFGWSLQPDGTWKQIELE